DGNAAVYYKAAAELKSWGGKYQEAKECGQQAETAARSTSDSISHFLSLMTPAADDVIRSTKAYLPLKNFGMPFRKPEAQKGWHHLSEVTSEIETFWSHSWHGRAWQKILTLLILYNSLRSMAVASLGAVLASCLYAVEVLPGYDVEVDETHFNSIWALATGCCLYFVLLFVARPREGVFVDVVCIDQLDRSRKLMGIRSIAALIKRTKAMIVLWDPTFSRRMWCLFELAAFLHSRSPGEKPRLIIRPTIFGPTLLFLTVAMALVQALVILMQDFRNTAFPMEGIVVFMACYVNVVTYRSYFRSIEELKHQLRVFSVQDATCYCCSKGHRNRSACDKDMLLGCITVWFGSVEVFEERVRTDVLDCLLTQLSQDFFSYRQCIVALCPVMWSGLDFASGGWLWCKHLNQLPGSDGYCGNSERGSPESFLAHWLIRGAVWWLGAVPLNLRLGMRAMYYLRKKCRWRMLDETLNLVILLFIAALTVGMSGLEWYCWGVLRYMLPVPYDYMQLWTGMILFGALVCPFTVCVFSCSGWNWGKVASCQLAEAIQAAAANPREAV
ncbi:unnamed protein product, partial [Symbiodinium sp. KB8]